jgi:zinc transporter
MHDPSHLRLFATDDQAVTPGLVWAYRGTPGQPATVLAAKDINAALASREGWVWLHVDLVDQRSHGWVGEICSLPPNSRAILEGHDTTFILGHEEGIVHGVAADLHSEIDRQSNSIGWLHFAVTENLLVTGRRHPLVSVMEVRQGLDDGLKLATAFDLFETIVTVFGKNTSQRLSEASLILDKVEDHLVTEQLADERKRLKHVRRLAVTLHRPISILVSLFRDEDRSDWKLSSNAHEVLRRLTMRLERLDRDVVMVNDRARLLQEELAAELADESNRSLRTLAIISALLLPGTLIVGIFGMNVGNVPLTQNPLGFPISLVICVAATGFFYWLLRRAGANLHF